MNDVIFYILNDSKQFSAEYSPWNNKERLPKYANSLTFVSPEDHNTGVFHFRWQDIADYYVHNGIVYNRYAEITDKVINDYDTVIVLFIYDDDNVTSDIIQCIKSHYDFLQKPNVIVLVVDPFEAEDEFKPDCIQFQNVLNKRIYVVSANARLQFTENSDKFVVYYYNSFMTRTEDIDYKVSYNPKKIYTNLNATVRYHRVELLNEIISNNLLQYGYNTWLGGRTQQYKGEIPESIIKGKFDVLDVAPMANRYSFLDNFQPYEYIGSSFLSLITETHTCSNKLFITEKTWRPIIIQHPFIILGNPGTLQKLKDMGFITFSQWIDETYDYDLSLSERIKIIIQELTKLSQLGDNKLKDIRKEMESVCKYNYDLFKIIKNRNNFLDTVRSALLHNRRNESN